MNQEIVIRKVQSGEDEAVWKIAKTLGMLERYYFYYLAYKPCKADALVAVDGKTIVGCVIPLIDTHAGEKVGMVEGIFVDRNVQGKGVGKALVDAALSHFQKEGCKTLYYIVDRFNSPSWNMALHRGFDLFEFNEQLRLFGWKILSLWWVNGYLWDPGTFLLRKTGKESRITREAGAGWHFLLAWLGFSLVLWMVGIRHDAPWLNYAPFVLGVAGVTIFAHELSHKLIARFLGLKTIFKVWESGLVISALLALLGVLIPFYGSTFIRQKDWSYNKDVKKMGLIYMAGPAVSLILASCFLALAYWANTEVGAIQRLCAAYGRSPLLGTVGFWANSAMVFFNLIPLFPFTPFDGKRIFLWNKTLWSLLVIWLILLLGVKTFL
ncbi:GNAT family N-acetyltransferase [Candidatus Bipolaricaulota bacterium]|nr:GNAT family N-acetyltransferase [Candidatus Bipolaricaulota bacterium]HBR09878.1 hypothetical protein [Candidatus Acetothermia bacterium]